jgi:8-oxo-dGTP diphosphatase
MIPDPREGREGVSPSRRYPAAPIVGVGAVIVVSDTQVVLVRRAREPLLGRWSLPGGALELGESLRLAVAREVREETGLDVEVGPIVDVIDHVEVDASGRVAYHFVIADFLCWPIEGVLRAGDDVDDVAVVADGEFDRYGVTEAARAVIRQAFELYTARGRRS